jgi:pimeloyl-ACP methyl ester carboxylesterase
VVRVVQGLQAQGYTVDVPANPLAGLATDTATLVDYLKTVSGPIVLVGHSYGGMVITDAATGNSQVKALVYVDAYIPAEGESALQLTSAQPGSCLGGGGNPANVFNFVTYPGAPANDDDLYVKVAAGPSFPGFARCFANDLPAAEGAVLASTQSPVTLSALAALSAAPAWKTIPSWDLVGTQDNVIPPAEQLFMARRADAHIVEVGASHLSMISHPAAVESIINQAAGAILETGQPPRSDRCSRPADTGTAGKTAAGAASRRPSPRWLVPGQPAAKPRLPALPRAGPGCCAASGSITGSPCRPCLSAAGRALSRRSEAT